MRLFTAVELPDEVRAAVAAEAREALADVPDLRFVAEEHLHVTVRFLGETNPGVLLELREALASAARSVAAGDAHTVGGIEALRWERVPRVFCAHVVDPAGVICGLERAATEALSALGIPPESRRFHPHVTVARVRRGGRRSPWRNSGPQRSLSDGPPRPFDVRALTLFESELTPGGPRYRVIDRFPLGATTATAATTAATTTTTTTAAAATTATRAPGPEPSGSPRIAEIPWRDIANRTPGPEPSGSPRIAEIPWRDIANRTPGPEPSGSPRIAEIPRRDIANRTPGPEPGGSPPGAENSREGVARMPTEPNVLCPTVPGDGREPQP